MSDYSYDLIEELDSVGMAQTFMGSATNVEGFRRYVAIKRVIPRFASHPRFIEALLNEVRRGAWLSHANIFSVVDLGKSGDSVFTMTDFASGMSLKGILDALRLQRVRLELKDVIHIAVQVCAALSYAHGGIDEDGNRFEMTHGNVSPSNILFTRRGEVRIADFGLAKARTHFGSTYPEIMEGKLNYLSPEAALGREVDQRGDVFAVGACVWEMLAGRRLFLGDRDYKILDMVSEARIPTLVDTHPEVNPQFEGIILKALTRDPIDRFPSAGEFSDALESYGFHHQMMARRPDLDLKRLICAALSRQTSCPPNPPTIDEAIREELRGFTSTKRSRGRNALNAQV